MKHSIFEVKISFRRPLILKLKYTLCYRNLSKEPKELRQSNEQAKVDRFNGKLHTVVFDNDCCVMDKSTHLYQFSRLVEEEKSLSKDWVVITDNGPDLTLMTERGAEFWEKVFHQHGLNSLIVCSYCAGDSRFKDRPHENMVITKKCSASTVSKFDIVIFLII